MRVKLEQKFTNEVVDSETTESPSQDLRHAYGYYVDVAYTGASLSGTVKLQTSHDNSTWRDIPNSGSTAHHTVAGSGGNVQWNIDAAHYPYVRISFTEGGAGAATVNAFIYTKGS